MLTVEYTFYLKSRKFAQLIRTAVAVCVLLTLSCGTSLPFIWTHWMMNAVKQRTAPAHSSRAKPPTRVRPNLTNSDVVAGGVSSFSPYVISRSAAFASVIPCNARPPAINARAHSQTDGANVT